MALRLGVNVIFVICLSEELDKFKHAEFQISRHKILCERVRVARG